MLQIKKGVSLAEVLIVSVLIGIIAVITIPTLLKSRPNKNKAMFRKAYYLTERVAAELKNNESLYPTADEYCSRYFAYDLKDTNGNIDTRYRTSNFVTNFANQLNTQGGVTTGARTYRMSGHEANIAKNRYIIEAAPTFTTTDGIQWYFNTNDDDGFCDPDRSDAYRSFGCSAIPYPQNINPYIVFAVDVNGAKAPNTFEGQDPDRFIIYIKYNGKVSVPHINRNGTSPSLEEQYLQSNTIM